MTRTPALLRGLFPSIRWQTDGAVLWTFDDGPDEQYTPKFAELLKKYDQSAVFFVVGNRVKQPAILRELISLGFEIGWHSETHRNFVKLTAREVKHELNARFRIEDLTARAIRYMRFPYGYFLPWHIRDVHRAMLIPMLWSVMFDDYKPISADSLKSAFNTIHDRDIVLLHDRSDNQENVYQAVANYLSERSR